MKIVCVSFMESFVPLVAYFLSLLADFIVFITMLCSHVHCHARIRRANLVSYSPSRSRVVFICIHRHGATTLCPEYVFVLQVLKWLCLIVHWLINCAYKFRASMLSIPGISDYLRSKKPLSESHNGMCTVLLNGYNWLKHNHLVAPADLTHP